MKEDIYIRFLKYAENKGKDGFTREECGKKFDGSSIIMQNAKDSGYIDMRRLNGVDIYFLTFEGKFKLLEYRELKFATHSSFEAKNIALFAIIISSVVPCLLFLLEHTNMYQDKIYVVPVIIIILMIYFGLKTGIIKSK